LQSARQSFVRTRLAVGSGGLTDAGYLAATKIIGPSQAEYNGLHFNIGRFSINN
jgi:hypothetical protein